MIESCADVRFRLMLLRRDELDGPEAETVRAHLAACADCAAEHEAERALDRGLARVTTGWSAPDELRRTVRAAVERQRDRGWRAAARRARVWAGRPLVAAALGATAALLVAGPGAYLLLRPRPEGPLAASLVETVAAYRSVALERQVAALDARDAGRIVAELQRLYRLPTTTTFHGDGEMRLVAARPVHALNRTGAVLAFADRAGRLVTLQILRAPELAIPREATTPVGSYRPVITRRDDLAVAMWKQGDALYALSAPADEHELSELFVKVRKVTTNPP